jgi:hypothetical protein
MNDSLSRRLARLGFAVAAVTFARGVDGVSSVARDMRIEK